MYRTGRFAVVLVNQREYAGLLGIVREFPISMPRERALIVSEELQSTWGGELHPKVLPIWD